MAVRRSDIIHLDAGKKTAEGYLDTEGTLTRTGVFEYTRDDGSIQRELRLPEHVFAADSLASFNGAPLSLYHPARGETVNAASFRDHVVGVVLDPKRAADGEHVRARIRVMDADAIHAVESGVKALSNGYDTVLVPIPNGVFQHPDFNEGKPVHADVLQTNIQGNHVALVPKGRAGPSARLDSAGNEKDDDSMELKEALAHIEALKARLDAADVKEATEAKARADAADKLAGEHEQLKTELKKHEDAEATRVLSDLAKRTAPILKKDVADVEKLGEEGIIKAVLAVTSPGLKIDGASIVFLKGAFEAAMSAEGKRTDSAADAADIVGILRTSSPKDDAAEGGWRAAERKYLESMENAYKLPLGPQSATK